MAVNKNNNRVCVICGTRYSYCPSGCAEDKGKPSWMTVFHDDNCRNIYYTCANYEIGHYGTKDQAKKKLKKLDLSNQENFNPVIKDWIDDIMGTTKTVEEEYTPDSLED